MAQAQDKLNRFLYEAALNGDKAKVIELLDRGATEDVLLPAVRQGHIAVIELLLDRGADIHKYEDQALRVAARDGYIEITKLLLDHGADVHAQDDIALKEAAEHGHTKVVEILLDHGADVHADDDFALLLAAEHGHKGTVELLLDRGADIHAQDEWALSHVAREGYKEVVELLLDRGADIHAREDYVLKAAARYGHTEVVELLKQHMAQEQTQEQQIKEGEKTMKNKVVELLKQHTAKEKASEFLNTETVLKELRAYPSHAYFKAGENQIDAHSETIESAYELFEPALSVYENGHLLFSENSACVGNYHFEPYTVGKFTSLPDTMNYLKEKYAGVEGWEPVDKPVPYVSEDHPRVWKNQSYAEREAMENKENQSKTNETKNKSETPINPIELKAKSPEGKIREINGKLNQGIKELFDSEKYKEYLQVMSKFNNYSVNNTVLIAMQMPTATNIAGFDAWKDNFSRNVTKGEKGIKIIAPTQVKIKQKIEKFDPKTGKPILGKDDKPVTEEREFTTTEFKVTNVFDVSQTRFFKDPKAPEDQSAAKNQNYKNFISAIEKSAVKNPNDFLAAIEKASPVPINITEKMNEQQALETAINEIAHAKLPKNSNEIQIESVKYVLSQHYGLDTSNYSFENVSNWSEGRDVKELRSSLHTISKTASKLINDINQNIISLRKEKAQAQGNEAEPREYHEHINEKYVAAMKAQEKEKAQEQAKVHAQKRSKDKTCEVGED